MNKTRFHGTKFDLSGQVALVTGASGLLGVQHSIALAEAGATVILTDIDSDKVKEVAQKVQILTGSQTHGLTMDVTDMDAIRKVNSRLEEMGLIVTRLVNNAAIDPKVKSNRGISSSRLESFDCKQFNLEVAVGLTGAIQCSAVFGPGMARMKDGVILNIASDLSVISPDQRLYHIDNVLEQEQPVKPVSYSVIKTGIIGLTRYLATYWARHNVRSNALSPGGVYNLQNDEFVTRLCTLIPLDRMAAEDEYRGAIQFMCSDAARYLNGQNIVMDGARSIL